MKILIYSHYFAPSVGGVERVVESLARGFSERGHHVTVATATPGDSAQDGELGYRVVRKPKPAALARLILQQDIVHLAGPALLPMFLAWLLRQPTVIEHHSFQSSCPNGQFFFEPEVTLCPGHFLAGNHGKCLRCNAAKGRLRSLWMWASTFPRRWLCHRATVHVMPTKWLSTQLRLAPCVTILHGVEPSAEPSSPPELCSSPRFAFVGRLVSTKGIGVLLNAANLLCRAGVDLDVRIIGDGPERSRCEAMTNANGLGSRTVFLGRVAGEEIGKALEGAWAVVVPSLAGEVFGLSAVEQMSRGRLVIASDIGPFREVVGDAGLRSIPGDSADLAGCMKRVVDDPGLATRLGGEGRRRALAMFGRDRMIEEHEKLYASLLDPRR